MICASADMAWSGSWLDRGCSNAALDRLADAQALRAGRRAPHRLAAGAARDQNDEVARLVDDRHRRVRIALVDPDREERPVRLAAVAREAPRLARHLEQRLLHVELLPAGRRDVPRVLDA